MRGSIRLVSIVASVAVGLLTATLVVVSTPRDTRNAQLQQRIAPLLDSIEPAASALERTLISSSDADVRRAYESLRRAYKRIEPLIEYADPELVTTRINGAPLPRIDRTSAFSDVLQPVGLQVLDEIVASEHIDRAEGLSQCIQIAEALHEAVMIVRRTRFSARMMIECARTSTIRITAMGLTAFDRPATEPDIRDDIGPLTTIITITDVLGDTASRLIAERAISLLRAAAGFDELDRLQFIRDELDPLFASLVDFQEARGIEFATEVASITPRLDPRARSMFSSNTLHPLANTGVPVQLHTLEAQELGRLLFFDPVLSGPMTRACASCHDPAHAFTDGRERSIALDGRSSIDRNAPTVLNAVHSKRFFYDLRAQRLDDVIEHVITNPREFGSSTTLAVERLHKSSEYQQHFRRAFPDHPGDPIELANVGRAISSYLATLSRMNAPVDRYLRGEKVHIEPAVRRGFNLFMGRAACGTCHFAPSFAGYVPPSFLETESEVIGVPQRPDTANAIIDVDLGRANGIMRDRASIYRHGFKTPTLRNIALTGPYMHNGVYATLEQVMDFYDRGGGAGIGITLPNQTLAADRLNFTAKDHADMIAFLRALTDTTGTTGRPARLPSFNDPRIDARIIGGEY
jgi:cytochrome c peroxidase